MLSASMPVQNRRVSTDIYVALCYTVVRYIFLFAQKLKTRYSSETCCTKYPHYHSEKAFI